ncbi:bacterial regulatory helix-turn-helix, lysR family protein [Burkholderia cenocepacia]|uniref:Bacterial regulatory helix-turn-helix, lysR family protein n=1 Tax=Burkholderia cenocepacia TaxID=95486 RepID=A0AAN0VMM5_9BURK|nr:bacterial regulatory helix-turn-helix, lysR family protein [Burkholderia cenocepacia]
MDLRQLKYFVRTCELKSLTRAAEQLYIAQPALGFQIRKLEEELETQLLIRHSRGVEPTPAGLVLLERASRLLEEADLTKATVRGFAGTPRGKVTLGMAPSFGYEFATQVVVRCLNELPDIALSLVQELGPTLVEWLRGDRLDLACLGPIDESDFVVEPLFTHDLCLIEASRGAQSARGPIPFAEVAAHPLILPSTRLGLRARLETLASEAGLSINATCETQSDALAFELVKQSVGATINTHTAVRQKVEEGTLIARQIVEPVISIDAVIAYKERRVLSRAATAVRSLIQRMVQEETPRMVGIWRSTGKR